MEPSVRPARWKDLLRQFVGGRSSLEPVFVAPVSDLRALSSREVGFYQSFSVTVGNPTATQHWVYTFTPANASKPIVLRLCWAKARLETATTLIGVRIGVATAKAATNAIFPIGDANADLGGAWTADEITAANLPLTFWNNFFSASLGPLERFPVFEYPDYFLELVIPQGQVAEIIARTADDIFDLALGYYTQPIV